MIGLAESMWRVWARGVLPIVAVCRGPVGVHLLVDDGREVPCRCRPYGFDASTGLMVWVAWPTEPVRKDSLRGALIDEVPAAVGHVVLELPDVGFVCLYCPEHEGHPADGRLA